MQNESQICETLKCPICLDFAEEPMECQECNNIFCKQCVINSDNKHVYSNCPICRKEISLRYSPFAKRLLNNMTIPCPNECGANTTRGELKTHLEKCNKRKYKCVICDFECSEEEFIKHFTTEHKSEILKQYDKNSNKGKNESILLTTLREGVGERKKMYVNSGSFEEMKRELYKIEKIDSYSYRNKKGNVSHMGEFGIFFCGKSLGFICGCCDGNCGPDNGCCCASCMEVTCFVRNVSPGYLVNCKGHVSRFENGNYTCGRQIQMKGLFNAFSKKVCKPTHPCEDCNKLTHNRQFYLP